MWIPTKNDAVEMFARQFSTRHRSSTSKRARETAAALDASGDREGYQMWNAVAEAIDRLRQSSETSERRAVK